MRTLISRAAALAAATAAIAVPAAAAAAPATVVLGWAPATAGGYNYGTLAPGHTAAQTFTLTNTGTAASSALKITLAGASAFTKTADTCTATSLGPKKTCTVTITYTAPATPGQASTATLMATASNPKATATVALAGAAAKTTPALATTPGGGGPAGTTVTGTAALTGGYQPTGTIDYQLYPTPDCSGPAADDETVTVTGNGTYTTPHGATPPAGTYSWTARYSGDTANNPAASGCGNAQVTITKAAPAITTTGSSGGPAGTTVTDTATLTGGYQPTGTIEYQLYPTPDCSGPAADDETVTVTGNGTYTTPHGATPPAGTYSWTARYSGDANNAPAATACGTDTVTLTGKATPAITQQATGGCNCYSFPLPTTTDTATLTGGDNPTGTIEFQLYDTTGSGTCSGTPVDDETVTVTGNGTYTTPNAYQPVLPNDTTAEYTWTASYSGDANNNPATTGCTGFAFYYVHKQ